jgi:hypothetical protein
MSELISAIATAIVTLIDAIKGQRIIAFLLLFLVTIIAYLLYVATSNQAILDSLTRPSIVAIAPPCAVQKIRYDTFAVSISFPLSDTEIDEMGIAQNVSALILYKEPKGNEIKNLCNHLIEVILDPEAEKGLVNFFPQYTEILRDYYQNNLPQDKPLRESDLPVPKPLLPDAPATPTPEQLSPPP